MNLSNDRDALDYDASTTRREFVLGATATALLLVGGLSSRGSLAPDIASAATGQWVFWDDRGFTHRLKSRPRRIVAYADAAASLWGFGVVPVGIFGAVQLNQDPQLAGMPLNRIQSLGTVYGEIKLEALAAARPDLIVSTWYPGGLAPPKDTPLFGFKDKAQEQTVKNFAPTLAINAHVVGTRGIRRFERLARALGANLDAPAVRNAKRRFQTASRGLQRAAARKRGLRVLAMSAAFGNVYVAKPLDNPDLLYFDSLGVDLVVPDTKDLYWELTSWEQIGKYPADVILHDARPHALDRDALMKNPAFAQLPAARAGQLGRWHAAAPFSYRSYARNLQELTAVISRSRRL